MHILILCRVSPGACGYRPNDRNPGTDGDFWLARSVESATGAHSCQGETVRSVARGTATSRAHFLPWKRQDDQFKRFPRSLYRRRPVTLSLRSTAFLGALRAL